MTCRALRRLVESVRENVESFFLALDQLHGSFSRTHQDLNKPNFVMPELLIIELWFMIGL